MNTWVKGAAIVLLGSLGGFSGSLSGSMPVQAQSSGSGTSLEEQLRLPVNTTELSQTRDIADQLLRLGEQQAEAGQYESSIRAWSRAIELYYDIGDNSGMIRAYGNIAMAYAQLGDYGAAETAVRRQLALARDDQDFSAQIFAWNNLGTLQLQTGNLVSANSAFSEALAVAQSVENFAGMGLSLSNLGLVAYAETRFSDAIKYYEAAGNFRARVGDSLGQANTNNNLGDVYLAQGQLSSAVGAYRLALTLGQEVNSESIQLHAIDGLISIYRQRGDWAEVRRYLDNRLALTLNHNDEWQRLVTLRHLGEFYESMNDLNAAYTTYQQALTLALSLEQKPLEGELTNRIIYLADVLGLD
jgi:tetratricopeptide (TPR) repeat protein